MNLLKYTKLPVLFLIFFSCTHFNTINSSITKKISQQNLNSFEWEDTDWPDDFNAYLHKCMENLKEGQPFQKRKLAFTLLEPLLKESNDSEAIMDVTTWQDLQLFYNEKSDDYLGAITNCAITEIGKTYLLCMLGGPTTNIKELKKRQKIVKELISNDFLFNEIECALQEIQKEENNMLSFYAKRDPFWQSAKRCYYSVFLFDNLNKNWLTLELKNRLNHYTRSFCIGASSLASVTLVLDGILTLYNQNNDSFFTSLRHRFEGSGGELGPLFSLLRYATNSHLIHSAVNICAGTYCALSLKEQLTWERDMLFLDHCLQHKLIGIKNYSTHSLALTSLINNHSILFENMSINTQKACTINDPMHQELVELLSEATFNGAPSFFSSKGKVLHAYKSIREQKDSFFSSLIATAELDFYYSIAKLVKKFEHNHITYSFAEYVEESDPILELEECWNPFINPKKAVANNILLSNKTRRNCIITGPNAGGKSCNLKACAISAILGQSLGIVPARKGRFTPFANILTHLNITDNIASETSLFRAEALRAQYILETVKKSSSKKFSLILADELFNGTTPNEGQAAAYSFAQCIGAYQNSICLLATHFSLLTELEQKTDYYFNYKVSIKYNDIGDIVFLFKTEPGISYQHIAFDILRMEGFDEDILTNAQALVQNSST